MVLERSEALLKRYVESLKKMSTSNPNHELISSFLDSQQERGIKVLYKRFNYCDRNSQMQNNNSHMIDPSLIIKPSQATILTNTKRYSSRDLLDTVVC